MENQKPTCALCPREAATARPFCGPLCESRHLQFANGDVARDKMTPAYFSLLSDEELERVLFSIQEPSQVFSACAEIPALARICRAPGTIKRFAHQLPAMRAYLGSFADNEVTAADLELVAQWILATHEQASAFAAFAVEHCLEPIMLRILVESPSAYGALVSAAIHAQSVPTLRFLFSLSPEFERMSMETTLGDFCYAVLDAANADLLEIYIYHFPWLLRKRQARDQAALSLVEAARRGRERFFLEAMRIFDFSTAARHNALTEAICTSPQATAAMLTVCTRADNWLHVLLLLLKSGRYTLPARDKIMHVVETLGMNAVMDSWTLLCRALHERGSVDLLFHLLGETPDKSLLDGFVTLEKRGLHGSALCITPPVLEAIQKRLPRYRPPPLLARRAANYGDLALLEMLQ